jgi:hypothetical protein
VGERDRPTGPPRRDETATPAAERIRRIVAAAEAEAVDIRHEADEYARSRRREAEAEADRLIREARRSADELVLERVRRISELSDAIVDRAHTVADGLERADQVQQRLGRLVEALAETADRVAQEVTIRGRA